MGTVRVLILNNVESIDKKEERLEYRGEEEELES